jgi:hypothetical protein
VALDRRPQVGFHGADANDFLSESDELCIAVATDFQTDRFTPKEDVGSRHPLTRRSRLSSLAQELPFQPGNVFAGKPPGFDNRATSRDRHAGTTVREQAQNVSPRPSVPDQMQLHAARSDHQPTIVRRSERPRADEKV